MKLEDLSVIVCKAVLLALALLLVSNRASYADVAEDHISSESLNIFTPDGRRMIGHARYTISLAGDSETLRGESYFLDGEHDIEIEVLRSDGQMPILVTYEHSFFNSDHTLERVVSFDSKARTASCKIWTRWWSGSRGL